MKLTLPFLVAILEGIAFWIVMIGILFGRGRSFHSIPPYMYGYESTIIRNDKKKTDEEIIKEKINNEIDRRVFLYKIKLWLLYFATGYLCFTYDTSEWIVPFGGGIIYFGVYVDYASKKYASNVREKLEKKILLNKNGTNFSNTKQCLSKTERKIINIANKSIKVEDYCPVCKTKLYVDSGGWVDSCCPSCRSSFRIRAQENGMYELMNIIKRHKKF